MLQNINCQGSKHVSQKIKLFCFSNQCKGKNIVCESCVKQHTNHYTVSFSKFNNLIKNYRSQIQFQEENPIEKDLKQEQQKIEILNFQSSIRKQLECSTLYIYKTKIFFENMSILMKDISEMLLEVEDVSEEHDLMNNILQLLDNSQDIQLIHHNFSTLFLLLKPLRSTSDGKAELIFQTSKVGIVRSKSLLDRQHEFTIVLKDTIQTQLNHFNQFLKRVANIVSENQTLFGPTVKFSSILISDNFQEEYFQAKEEEQDDYLSILNSSNQDLMIRESTGFPRCDTPEEFHGSRKQMIQLANYWIFYNNIVCNGTFPEPVYQDINIIKGKKIIPPIRCAFCKLIKSKDYINGYFKYDPTKRCGLLCQLKDTQGREILAHEMCLLWSNRVQANYNTYSVELYSVIMAVEFSKTQKCRYCGYVGASLKCSKPECQVYFHWLCLIQVKLLSMQLDFDARYRFYCEDHIIRTSRYRSDWFLTRIRMMNINQGRKGIMISLGDRPKPDEDNYSEEEPKLIKTFKQLL